MGIEQKVERKFVSAKGLPTIYHRNSTMNKKRIPSKLRGVNSRESYNKLVKQMTQYLSIRNNFQALFFKFTSGKLDETSWICGCIIFDVSCLTRIWSDLQWQLELPNFGIASRNKSRLLHLHGFIPIFLEEKSKEKIQHDKQYNK